MKRIVAAICTAVVGIAALGAGGAYYLSQKHKESVEDGIQPDETGIGEISFYATEAKNIELLNGCTHMWFANNELLVSTSDGTSREEIEEIAGRIGAEIVGCIEQTGDYQLLLSETCDQDTLEEIAAGLCAQEGIGSASLKATPHISRFSKWDIEKLPARTPRA